MEINRPFKSVPVTGAERPKATREVATSPARAATVSRLPQGDLPLGQLQEALQALPEVDLEKVEEIKQALQRGEIPVDAKQLARSVLNYHRSGDV